MGVAQSRLLLDQEPPSSLHDRVAEEFDVIRQFPVDSSGRLSRSFLIQLDGVKAVVKAIWVSTEAKEGQDEQWLQDQVKTLQQLKQASISSVATFSQWRLLPSTTTARVAYAMRPHCYTVLADRLLSRPWLLEVEKLVLTHQLLTALAQLHAAGCVHGSVTTHNIGLSADGTRLILLDVASTLRDAAFPDNDPSIYHRWCTRCTAAPERFFAPPVAPGFTITPAMDLFSAGCVIAEIFVGGDAAAMEWGDWMSLREAHSTPQFLFKIESSAVRAAVKHMLGQSRWTEARLYLERLPVVPACLLVDSSMAPTHPDARLVAAVEAYPVVLQECLGLKDTPKQLYFETLLGSPTKHDTTKTTAADITPTEEDAAFEKVQALLKGLEIKDERKESEARKSPQSDYLAIYLQRILANIRHAQRVSSKLVGLQLIHAVAGYTSDPVRLERIVPVIVSMLSDVDAQVRAVAVTVLTAVVDPVEQFAPSDSKLFPEYIFKRVGILASDPSWLVRTAFSKCLANLANSALKFCNVSHAVRLHEAVASARDSEEPSKSAFAADVADLLEPALESSKTKTTGTSPSSLLIPGHYQVELNQLFEFVSRWVVQITTDSSSVWPKRALLSECSRLCVFFGFDHIVTFLLPQLLTFFSVKELRADLFHHLPELCQAIGRAATEEYVLAFVEIGLVDDSELVVAACLRCLSRLVELGLVISRRWQTYCALLVHPSESVRDPAIAVFSSLCRSAGSPDTEVYFVPMLCPFLRFQPTVSAVLNTPNGMRRVVKQAWEKTKWNQCLSELVAGERNRSAGTWTSIGVVSESGNGSSDNGKDEIPISSEQQEESCVRLYLKQLARHSVPSRTEQQHGRSLAAGIEGSLKLAQSILFPRQNGRYQKAWLPNWYAQRSNCETDSERKKLSTETCIRLSIMGVTGTGSNDESQHSEGDARPGPDSESEIIDSFFGGEWHAEAKVEPDVVDTCMLVTKLKGLGVPPLPVKLGDPTSFAGSARDSTTAATDSSRPRVKGLLATSTKTTGHTAPVMRLAVSIDQRFLVSGSHDGTCRVWEIPTQPEHMAGLLLSKATYTGHNEEHPVKVNDVAMLEGTHSVVSGDNMGRVHVWRVDLQQSTAPMPAAGRFDTNKPKETTRIVGASSLYQSSTGEGEVLAVSHFNTSSSCVVTYATQKGMVHSLDLRSSQEPFRLPHSPELGFLTSMALGSDRHWIVTGTRQGYLALWDIRYQQCVSLWRHSRETSIVRLATSMVSPPRTWGAQGSLANARPYVFVAAGNNECAMFDVQTATCCECFRTIDGGGRLDHSNIEEPPHLVPVPIASKRKNDVLKPITSQNNVRFLPTLGSLNCMVGSIGVGQNSYLVTGGSDARIRLWDFMTPSKCAIVSGQPALQPRPSFERIDFEGRCRLLLCRESQAYQQGQQHFHGVVQKPDNSHTDSIQDIKVLDQSLVSCSRDCTVKVWR